MNNTARIKVGVMEKAMDPKERPFRIGLHIVSSGLGEASGEPSSDDWYVENLTARNIRNCQRNRFQQGTGESLQAISHYRTTTDDAV